MWQVQEKRSQELPLVEFIVREDDQLTRIRYIETEDGSLVPLVKGGLVELALIELGGEVVSVSTPVDDE